MDKQTFEQLQKPAIKTNFVYSKNGTTILVKKKSRFSCYGKTRSSVFTAKHIAKFSSENVERWEEGRWGEEQTYEL